MCIIKRNYFSTWMITWKEALGRGEFREAMAVACSFFQVEEMYPDQEKVLIESILKAVIFSSARTQSISDPSSDLNKIIRSVYKLGKRNKQLLVLEKQY